MSTGDAYDAARRATDEVLGAGTYDDLNRNNPDPGVQAAIERARRDPLDPPTPIPAHLYPQRAPLGPEDLRVALSTGELRAIAKVLDHDHVAGQTLVTQRDGSPWVEVDVAVPLVGEAREYVSRELDGELSAGPVIRRYAVWRYTGKVYRVGADGAVEDDPIELS